MACPVCVPNAATSQLPHKRRSLREPWSLSRFTPGGRLQRLGMAQLSTLGLLQKVFYESKIIKQDHCGGDFGGYHGMCLGHCSTKEYPDGAGGFPCEGSSA